MSSGSSGGTSALTLLGVVFVALKMAKVITWSWWWVTAPFWGPLFVVVFAAIVIVTARSGKRKGERWR